MQVKVIISGAPLLRFQYSHVTIPHYRDAHDYRSTERDRTFLYVDNRLSGSMAEGAAVVCIEQAVTLSEFRDVLYSYTGAIIPLLRFHPDFHGLVNASRTLDCCTPFQLPY